MSDADIEGRINKLERSVHRARQGQLLTLLLCAAAIAYVVLSRPKQGARSADRDALEAMMAAQYQEEHPAPSGAWEDPPVQKHAQAWLEYRRNVMERFELLFDQKKRTRPATR